MTNGDTPVADPSLTRPAKRGAMVRFVWQTDRIGRFHFPDMSHSPDVNEAIAALVAHYDGSLWPQGDIVGDALAAQMTFVGVETLVPLHGNKATRLVLSGTPVVGSDGAFDGFRGFGFMEAPVVQIAVPAQPPIEPKPVAAPMPAAPMGLSASERQAFREIARALGARPDDEFESEEPAAYPSEPVALQAKAPEPVTAPPTSDRMAEILDRLPLGILISRGGVPIVMNRPLLDWLGYDSIDGFHDAGGIDTMFGGRDPSRRSSYDEGAMLLRRRDGDMLALGVKLQTLQWDDLPASMMLFEPIGARDEAANPYDSDTHSESSGVSADELSAILDTATDGVIVLDRDGRILSMNRSAEALFEFDTSEIAGERFTSLLVEDSRARALDYLEGLKDNGVASVLNDGREVMGQTRVGGRLPLFMTLGRIGTLAEPKYCAVLRDITIFKRAERDFIEARRAAETASARKSDFLARISHEIRTPMNGVMGMADLLIDTSLDAEQGEYVSIIKSSANALLRVINDILDFSKIEAGKLLIEHIPFNLGQTIDETLKAVALRAHDKGLELVCDMASNVPLSVVGDPGRLRQILVNLIGNAIKFTVKGEVVLRVQVQSIDADSMLLHMAVSDSGIGIAEDKLDSIFEAFSQEDSSTTRKFGGTGLGLTISARLVEALGGNIWVESTSGKGSTFHFTMQVGLDATQTPVGQSLASFQGLRVLVVDDNEVNRMVLGRALQAAGVQVQMAESGQTALATLSSSDAASFDLVVLDAQMPGMDGFTLAEKIRLMPVYLRPPLVMLSSSGLKGDAQRAQQVGIAGYASKPVSREELVQVLARALQLEVATAHPATLPEVATRQHVRLDVLLVEDHAINQKLAVALLERWGHRVTVAANGKVALDELETNHFDVVLMDMLMPVMDGLDATRHIREREQQQRVEHPVPIIAMTANAMEADRDRCLEVGMNDYLSKPINAADLQEILQRYAGNRGSAIPSAAQSAKASSASAEKAAPFDYMQALRQMDQEVLEIIAQAFVDQWPVDAEKMRTALRTDDLQALLHTAHALKGTTAMFGAAPASALAARIEALAATGDAVGAAMWVEPCFEAVQSLLVAIETSLSSAA
jgi:PAS domain S-box-containing protein